MSCLWKGVSFAETVPENEKPRSHIPWFLAFMLKKSFFAEKKSFCYFLKAFLPAEKGFLRENYKKILRNSLNCDTKSNFLGDFLSKNYFLHKTSRITPRTSRITHYVPDHANFP